MIGDLPIIVSPYALTLVVTDERLFPVSRHRSKRIHKKLIKRYGGEFKIIREPAIWNMLGKIVLHPSLYEEFKRNEKR